MTEKKDKSDAAQPKRKSTDPKILKSPAAMRKSVASAVVKPKSAVVKPKPEVEHKKPKGLLYYLGVGLSAGLFAVVLLIAAMAIVIPMVSGSTPMTILTGSMTPAYPPGTLIIVQPVKPATLIIGDSITYQIESGKPAVVTHRIIAITSVSDGARTFTTKGDANSSPDEKQVIGAQIRGKVWYSIPYLGWVNTWVNGESRAWIVPVLAGGLFLYAGYMAASAIADAIKRRKTESAEGIPPAVGSAD